ncbi:DUF6881 domain-containing protein [Bradyrhizobium roseum]|uniref:DUF6881 domain-containing protein n=1 Tax=Bradyrhizobium roseum TaxID=3056648 RepID=UPI00262D271F|nr:hypothetical protein [Bradyrhizobium roseus]WKA26900.1 hypothetical protein QUH67_25435 [Bradyrhizobium roseus]
MALAVDYIKVGWKQNALDTPLLLYSELDDKRWEVRKVEVFPDGSLGYADRSTPEGTTFLSLEPLPTLLQIALMPEFDAVAITKDEFETIWLKATVRTSEA